MHALQKIILPLLCAFSMDTKDRESQERSGKDTTLEEITIENNQALEIETYFTNFFSESTLVLQFYIYAK